MKVIWTFIKVRRKLKGRLKVLSKARSSAAKPTNAWHGYCLSLNCATSCSKIDFNKLGLQFNAKNK